MFHISTNIEQPITKKKKFLFISTLSSNETSSFEPKNINFQNSQYHTSLSKCSSLKTSTKSRKSTKNKKIKPKKLPMKKIFFRLYRVNLINEKEKENEKSPKNLNKIVTFKMNNKIANKHGKKMNISNNNKNYFAGRWKYDEHQRFIDAIIKYGNNWRQVQKYVGTRSSTQTRSHSQKFFEKLKRSKIFNEEKYDFSKNSLKILHDIMKNLSDNEYNLILKALHSLSSEKNSDSDKVKSNFEMKNDGFNLNDIDKENNNNYDGNCFINYNNEENNKNIKYNNQGFYFLDNNGGDKDDYMFYNFSFNDNAINNNYNGNNYFNYENKSYGRKGSDFFTQRKNSLFEMNLNIKDLKEPKNDFYDYNLDYKKENNYLFNNIYKSNNQQDNSNKINKIFENNDDKDDKDEYKQLGDFDFIFSEQASRKISMVEEIN